MTTHFSCPVEVTLSIIGGKWKPGILWQLHDGPRRFGQTLRTALDELAEWGKCNAARYDAIIP